MGAKIVDINSTCVAAGQQDAASNISEDRNSGMQSSYSWDESPDRLSLASTGVRSFARASRLTDKKPRHQSLKAASISADKHKHVRAFGI